MKIAICIKQVPDSEEIRINPETNTLERDTAQAVLNPFDLYAIEEGVRLSEKLPRAETLALSMGPPRAEDVLRQALSLGVHEAALLCDTRFSGADSWATGYALAGAIKKSGAAMVLCGKQATDGDTAQVAPGIAAHLDWPQICYVTSFDEITEDYAIVTRLLDHGTEKLRVELPAVFSVLKDVATPRLPTLEGMLRGRQACVTHWDAQMLDLSPEQCGLKGSPTRVRKIFTPSAQSKTCQMLGAGSAQEQVKAMAQIIQKV